MLKCYLGRFSVRRRCVAPHYRLHWATKIRKIREINTFRHYFSPRGPKKCATAKWAQGRNATAMRAGGAGGRATGQRRAGTRAGQDARAGGAHEPAGTRAGGHTTEGGGPDGGVDGWTGSQVQQPVQRPVQQPAQRPTCCSSHSRRASPRKSTATTRRSPSSSRLCGMVRMSNRRNRES